MRKNIFTTFLGIFCFCMSFSQVGIGNSTPNGVLDLTNSNTDSKVYPLVIPTKSGADASSNVINPRPGQSLAVGSVYYDLTEDCLKVYDGTQWKCEGFPEGGITALDCTSAVTSQVLTAGEPSTGVVVTIPYTGGNKGVYEKKTFSSKTITGLTATLPLGILEEGDGNVILTISGTPSGLVGGTAQFDIELAGKTCTLGIPVEAKPGTITSVNCGGVTKNGSLTSGTSASGVSFSIPYEGGNGGSYSNYSVVSTGVTGLTASLSSGSLNSGSGSLSFTVSGTPSEIGTATFDVSIMGKTCSVSYDVRASFSMDCGKALLNGSIYDSRPVEGVFVLVPYNGGNGSSYNAKTINSTGMTGLTATLEAGNLSSSNQGGNFRLDITGNTSTTTGGVARFEFAVNGEVCFVDVVVLPATPLNIDVPYLGLLRKSISPTEFYDLYNEPHRASMTAEEKTRFPANEYDHTTFRSWSGKAVDFRGVGNLGQYEGVYFFLRAAGNAEGYTVSNYSCTSVYSNCYNDVRLRDIKVNGVSVASVSELLSEYGVSFDGASFAVGVSDVATFKSKVGVGGEIIITASLDFRITRSDGYSNLEWLISESKMIVRLEEAEF